MTTETIATAMAHMRRELLLRGKWQCNCEACVELQADIVQIRNEMERSEHFIGRLPDGEDKQRVTMDYNNLLDRLTELQGAT